MSKCPICETENADGVLICSFCGTELPEEKEAPATNDTAAKEESAPAAAPTSAPASDSFFDNPNYGIIAIVCSIFLTGLISLVVAILGMTKSTNEDVRKKCKIALIITIALVAISVVFSIIYGVVLGAAAGSGAVDPSAIPVYGSCLGGF